MSSCCMASLLSNIHLRLILYVQIYSQTTQLLAKKRLVKMLSKIADNLGFLYLYIWRDSNPIVRDYSLCQTVVYFNQRLIYRQNICRPRSEPALELHSRAASSVGFTSLFQRSQHRKQFRRKADNKKKKKLHS